MAALRQLPPHLSCGASLNLTRLFSSMLEVPPVLEAFKAYSARVQHYLSCFTVNGSLLMFSFKRLLGGLGRSWRDRCPPPQINCTVFNHYYTINIALFSFARACRHFLTYVLAPSAPKVTLWEMFGFGNGFCELFFLWKQPGIILFFTRKG